MLSIYDLKCEYLHKPRGMDALHPRFSWKLKSDRQGVMQTCYQITAVADNQIIWSSGVVLTADSQYIRYAGETLRSRQQVLWWVEVTTIDESGVEETAQSEAAWFEMGLLNQTDWVARWVEPEVEVDTEARKPAPYLRQTFEVKAGLKQARIYQTAHGLYQFWINGQAGTEDCFNPGITSYYHRIQYQVYDITGLLKEGRNAWAVMLGDGWWRGVTGGTVKNNFGYKLHYLGQIELLYEDGTTEIIGTDETFRHAKGGLQYSDMLMGDLYDATKEPDGWKLSAYDDSNWQPVHVTKERTDAQLIAVKSVPVREKETFQPRIFTDANKKRVLDFGQNIAGYVKMRVHDCVKGQVITLTHGEDMKEGAFSIDNINQCSYPVDAFQEVSYICAGEPEEIYCPMFSIFGFRYVMLEGYNGVIQEGDFTAIAVYSDMEETGDFRCSHPLINQLVKNSRWSQKGNFMDVPVDCPTRERNSWTGDCQIYVRTATNFMNVYPFFEKCLQDMAIEQFGSGKIGITFPSTSSIHNPAELARVKKVNAVYELAGPDGNGNIGEDCAGWGDAAVWVPYVLYLCYGDVQILENQYNTAKRWVDYMFSCAKEHNTLYENQPQYHTYDEDGVLEADYIYDTRMHYGEWQEPIPMDPTVFAGLSKEELFMRMVQQGKPLVATAYMCRSAENVAHMAELLGKTEDSKKYSRISEKIKKVYDKYLISDDGTIEPGHQAAYVRALVMDLCSEQKREKVLAKLIEEIEANDYCLNTGFLSTPFLLPVLVENGYSEIAFRILEQTKNPSWLHAVELGATTILESWDGLDRHDASYNHYSYGAVCEFLFAYVAGIRPSFSKPGYQEFSLKPVIGGSLTYAEAEYESIYGRIISSWERNGETIHYRCTVPANTSAQVRLPDGRNFKLGSGSYQFELK